MLLSSTTYTQTVKLVYILKPHAYFCCKLFITQNPIVSHSLHTQTTLLKYLVLIYMSEYGVCLIQLNYFVGNFFSGQSVSKLNLLITFTKIR